MTQETLIMYINKFSMKYLNVIMLIALLVATYSCDDSCNMVNQNKVEIISVEKLFEEMVEEKGMAEAFYYFAGSNAVICRNDSIIKGKDSIKAYLSKYANLDISLKWSPDVVDVSSSGDLAYSYGRYNYIVIDSLGNENVTTGIYHTIWKRQPNGEWKYVWD